MSSVGQKVTNDPRSQQPIHEAVGVVTSDSLAAESLQNNGAGHFGEGNIHAAASKQPSKSTTTNTTDTSGATKLSPTHDSGEREDKESTTQGAINEFNASRDNPKAHGVGPTYAAGSGGDQGSGAQGGQSHQTGSQGGQSHKTGGHEGQSRQEGDGNANPAPTGSYAGSAEQARNDFKPKGKSLTEGGFEGNEPNASFNNEIGTENDPGRVAENKFAGQNALAAEEGSGPRQQGVTGKGWYDPLKSDQQV